MFVGKETRVAIIALLVGMEGMSQEDASTCVDTLKARTTKWLNRKQAASMLGVTPRTLTRWQDEGRIEPVRISCRKHRFAEQDVINLMKNKKKYDNRRVAK